MCILKFWQSVHDNNSKYFHQIPKTNGGKCHFINKGTEQSRFSFFQHNLWKRGLPRDRKLSGNKKTLNYIPGALMKKERKGKESYEYNITVG